MTPCTLLQRYHCGLLRKELTLMNPRKSGVQLIRFMMFEVYIHTEFQRSNKLEGRRKNPGQHKSESLRPTCPC